MDVLYELFFTLSRDYDIKPIRKSEFLADKLEENYISLTRKTSGELDARILYWDIPDEYFEEVSKITIGRFETYAEKVKETVLFLQEQNDRIKLMSGILWAEIKEKFNRALRSEARDSIAIDCPLFTEGAKIHRISFVTEGYKAPEVGLRFHMKWADIEHECDGELVKMKVNDKESVSLLAPITVKSWFAEPLLAIIMDAYHSIVVKEKSEVRDREWLKKEPHQKGSRDHYISKPENDVIRANVRRLPDGHKARWQDDPKRREKCIEHYGGNIPDGFTFVKEYPNPFQKEECLEAKTGDLYTYRDRDIFNLLR
jgi:hypothetical protein